MLVLFVLFLAVVALCAAAVWAGDALLRSLRHRRRPRPARATSLDELPPDPLTPDPLTPDPLVPGPVERPAFPDRKVVSDSGAAPAASDSERAAKPDNPGPTTGEPPSAPGEQSRWTDTEASPAAPRGASVPAEGSGEVGELGTRDEDRAAGATEPPVDTPATEPPAPPVPTRRTPRPGGSPRRSEASARSEGPLRGTAPGGSGRRPARVRLQRLDPSMRTVYATSWQRTQARFADDPLLALTDADKLVALLMDERGYPTEAGGRVRTDVATDPAGVIDDYRSAHRVVAEVGDHEPSSQELRRAMDAYRRMVASLLEDRSLRVRR